MRNRSADPIDTCIQLVGRLPWKVGVTLALLTFVGLHIAGLYSPFVAHYHGATLAQVRAAAARAPHEPGHPAPPSANAAIMQNLTHEVCIGLPAAICYLLQFVIPPALLLGAIVSAIRSKRASAKPPARR